MTIQKRKAAGFGWPGYDYPGSGLFKLPRPMLMAEGDPPPGDDDAEKKRLEAIEAEVKKRVDDAVKTATDEATKGLKAKNEELLGKLNETKENLAKFGDLDADRVKALMERLDNDEEAKLIAEGKIEEVIERRHERLQKENQKLLEARDAKIAELTTENAGLTERLKKLVVDGKLNEAIDGQEGFVQAARPDAIFRGRQIFSLGDEDELVPSDGNGTIIGPDGKTPLTPAEWLEGMKEAAPHWWAGSSGGGAGGGEPKDKETNPFLKATWNFTEQNRLAKTDKPKYDRLKAAAEATEGPRGTA